MRLADAPIARPATLYPQLMYRALVMFPKSASPAEVDALIEGIAASFTSSGSQPITRSVGSLMGPGAQGGEAGWILEADFATLEDALTALDAEDFRAMKAAVEAVTSALFLFEMAEL
jgi:hypothetical protein